MCFQCCNGSPAEPALSSVHSSDVQAIELIHNAVFYNHGQNCCAGSRLFVHKSIHDEVAQRLADRAQKRVVGDPFAEGTEQGPQVDEAQMKKILGYIESGQQQGAQLLTGVQLLMPAGADALSCWWPKQ